MSAESKLILKNIAKGILVVMLLLIVIVIVTTMGNTIAINDKVDNRYTAYVEKYKSNSIIYCSDNNKLMQEAISKEGNLVKIYVRDEDYKPIPCSKEDIPNPIPVDISINR